MMTDLGAKLRRMPPDRRRATLANLPSHLANADESDRLYFLLMNFAFIEAKIFELELRSLVEDYVLAVQSPLNIPEEKKGTLRLLQRAIQLSAHILERDKTQLASQLIGRLFSFPEIEIQNLLECVKSSQSRTWIRPLTPTLTPPDDTLTGTLVGHRGPVQAVTIVADGRRAISGGEDKDLYVWDLAAGTRIHHLSGHHQGILAVAVTPDGQKAVSASRDTTLKIWDLMNGREIKTLSGHTAPVLSVAITPDGARVISISADRSLKIWDLRDGTGIPHPLLSPLGRLAIAITPDGKYLLSSREDNTIGLVGLKRSTKIKSSIIVTE